MTSFICGLISSLYRLSEQSKSLLTMRPLGGLGHGHGVSIRLITVTSCWLNSRLSSGRDVLHPGTRRMHGTLIRNLLKIQLYSGVAQLVERCAVNAQVVGSNPPPGAIVE